MQGRPALVVRLVHSGALLHQEAHHLQVLINAGLGVGNSRQPHLRQPRCPSKAGLQRQPRKQIQGHGARTVGKTTPTASGRQLFKIPPIAQWSGPPSLRRSVETTKGLPATCKQEVSGEGRGLLIRCEPHMVLVRHSKIPDHPQVAPPGLRLGKRFQPLLLQSQESWPPAPPALHSARSFQGSSLETTLADTVQERSRGPGLCRVGEGRPVLDTLSGLGRTPR